MRLVGSLLVALFLAGCGAATQQTNVPASSGEGETVKPPKGYVASDVKPPQIVLLSETGRQTAVQGSYCVTGDEQGICVDMASPLVPKAVTVVQPGDQVTIAMPEATLKKDSVATVRPLGCADRRHVRSSCPLAESWIGGSTSTLARIRSMFSRGSRLTTGEAET